MGGTQTDNPEEVATRLGRRSLLAVLALALGTVATNAAAHPISALANSDPNRMFAATSPFDLPASFCGFVVHVGIDVNKEYETVSVAPDGSTVIKVTGYLVLTVTNESTGRSIEVTASGPGTTTILPNSSSGSVEATGVTLFYAANGTELGLPSDLMVTSGPLSFDADFATDTITGGLTRQPHVLVNVCATLS